MSAKETFERFSQMVNKARADVARKKEMGELLAVAIESAGKKKKDIVDAHIADRASVDRWLNGNHVPQPNQVENLRKFLLDVSGNDHPFCMVLLDPRYRPVINFVLQQETKEAFLNKIQISSLFELAEKSKGTLSPEMIRIFLGLAS